MEAEREQIAPAFLNQAASVLAHTSNGVTGSEIIAVTTSYAVTYEVNVPHPYSVSDAPNKRTALRENLQAFPPAGQFEIICALCDHPQMMSNNPEGARQLKRDLVARYRHLAPQSMFSEVSSEVVDETRHWLEPYPEVLHLYSEALGKYRSGTFQRNVLDDLRLAFETLLRNVLRNQKSLEKQIGPLGEYLKHRGGSAEFRSMFTTLIRYFNNYQNEYVKHNDAVIEDEVGFIIEIASSLMKHVIRTAAS